MSNRLISALRIERKEASSESSEGQLRRLCLNISRQLNSVVRVLWRPSKLCTWFVFHPHNLLSLDTASSSYLISALWDIKYTLMLKNSSFGGTVGWGGRDQGPFWAVWKKDLWRFGSRVWTVKGVLNGTESHTDYIATIIGSINAFFVPTAWTSPSWIPFGYFYEAVQRTYGTKFSSHGSCLCWTVSANTSSDLSDAS